MTRLPALVYAAWVGYKYTRGGCRCRVRGMEVSNKTRYDEDGKSRCVCVCGRGLAVVLINLSTSGSLIVSWLGLIGRINFDSTRILYIYAVNGFFIELHYWYQTVRIG